VSVCASRPDVSGVPHKGKTVSLGNVGDDGHRSTVQTCRISLGYCIRAFCDRAGVHLGWGSDVDIDKLGRRHICDFGRDEIRTRIDDTVDVGKDGGVGGSDNQGEFVPVVGDGRRRLCRHIGHRYQRDHKQEYQDDAEKKDEFSHFEPPFLSRKKLWSLETTVSAFAATAEILLWRLRPP